MRETNGGRLGGGAKGETLFTGGLNCESNDFVTMVKPRGGVAAWVITVRKWGGN